MHNDRTIDDVDREMEYHCSKIANVGIEIELNREAGAYPLWKRYDQEVAVNISQSVRRSFELVLWESMTRHSDYHPLQDAFLNHYRVLCNVQEMLYAARGTHCGVVLGKAVVMSVLMLLNNTPHPMIMTALKANYFLNDVLSIDLTGDGRDSDGIASQTTILRLVAQNLTVSEFELFFNHTTPMVEQRFPLFSETFVFFHCPTSQVSTKAKEAVLLIIQVLQRGLEDGGKLKSVLPWFADVSIPLFQDLACMWRDFLVWRAECQSSQNYQVEHVCTQSLNDLFAYIGDLLAQSPEMLTGPLLEQLEMFVLQPIFLRPLMVESKGIPPDRYCVAAANAGVGLYYIVESLQGISHVAWRQTIANCLLRPISDPSLMCPPATPQSTMERKQRWAEGFQETSPRRDSSTYKLLYRRPWEGLVQHFQSGADDHLIPAVGVVEELFDELENNNPEAVASLISVLGARLLSSKPVFDITVDAFLCLFARAWGKHEKLVIDALRDLLLGLQKTLVFDEIEDAWDRACQVGRCVPDCFNDFYQKSAALVRVTSLFIFLRTRRMLMHLVSGMPWDSYDTACLVNTECISDMTLGTPCPIAKNNRIKCETCRLPDRDIEQTFYVLHSTHLLIVQPDDQKTLWGRPVVLQPLSNATRIEMLEAKDYPVPAVRIEFARLEEFEAKHPDRAKQIVLFFADSSRAAVCYRSLKERYDARQESMTSTYRAFVRTIMEVRGLPWTELF
eukprot:GEMP01014456.1.p1 GENE.GEMP01014456.1~~GEMP01014456.1.p1  ORF type:complete len:731 (+),score=159.06 GEMP01014456.1:161-2353(+)